MPATTSSTQRVFIFTTLSSRCHRPVWLRVSGAALYNPVLSLFFFFFLRHRCVRKTQLALSISRYRPPPTSPGHRTPGKPDDVLIGTTSYWLYWRRQKTPLPHALALLSPALKWDPPPSAGPALLTEAQMREYNNYLPSFSKVYMGGSCLQGVNVFQ